MAGVAGDAGMLPIERETGRHAVIKLRAVKSHNMKIFAVVIAMALRTPFVGHMSVDSPGGVHGGFDLLVAIETFVVGEGLPVRMARRAFADSFQLLVRAGEFAGRELRLDKKGNERSKYQQDPSCDHLTAPHVAREKRGRDVEFEKVRHLADGRKMADAFPGGIDNHVRENHPAPHEAEEVSDASGTFEEMKKRVEGSLREAARIEVTSCKPREDRSKAK